MFSRIKNVILSFPRKACLTEVDTLSLAPSSKHRSWQGKISLVLTPESQLIEPRVARCVVFYHDCVLLPLSLLGLAEKSCANSFKRAMQGNKKLAMAVHSPCFGNGNEAEEGKCTMSPVTLDSSNRITSAG